MTEWPMCYFNGQLRPSAVFKQEKQPAAVVMWGKFGKEGKIKQNERKTKMRGNENFLNCPAIVELHKVVNLSVQKTLSVTWKFNTVIVKESSSIQRFC